MTSSDDQLSNANIDRLRIILAMHRNELETIRTALSDSKASVRSSALLALAQLGQIDETILCIALEDEAAEVRRRACEISPRYPRLSLTGVLDDEDPYVVEMALWAVGERESSENLAKIMEIAVKHKESLVRESAIAALGAIGNENAMEVILNAMKDRPNVRRRAVVAMAAFDDEKITLALKDALSDRDWQVRQIAEDLLEITEGSSD